MDIANMDVLNTEIEVTSKDLMIQRVTSENYLNEWYVENVFIAVSRKLKELKTLEEILEIVERLCIEIYVKEMTFEAYEYFQCELDKLTAN